MEFYCKRGTELHNLNNSTFIDLNEPNGILSKLDIDKKIALSMEQGSKYTCPDDGIIVSVKVDELANVYPELLYKCKLLKESQDDPNTLYGLCDLVFWRDGEDNEYISVVKNLLFVIMEKSESFTDSPIQFYFIPYKK